MTLPPPPGPYDPNDPNAGSVPPPPAPGQYPPQDQYGAQPGYAAGPPMGYGQPVPARPYAEWGSRVGAYLVDGLLTLLVIAIPALVGIIMLVSSTERSPFTNEVTSVNPAGVVFIIIGALLGLAFTVWNRGVRTGRTGQSIGKKMLSIEVVSAETGQYLGAGTGVLRWLLDYILGNACFLNYLWPLWDAKKQTWHDMILKSVVVKK